MLILICPPMPYHSPSKLKPCCMPTVLSTVPFRDPDKACSIVREFFPEAPCIPKLSLSMRRYIGGMPCLIIDRKKRRITYDLSRDRELSAFYERVLEEDLDYFAIDPKYAPGFYFFLKTHESSHPPSLIHIGLPGPFTWGLSMADHVTGVPAWYDPTMRDVLIRTLIMKAKWQEKTVGAVFPGTPILFSFGEPSLGVMDSPFGSVSSAEVMDSLEEIFRSIDSFGEVHCCSNTDWAVLMKSPVDVINFDAFRFADRISLYPDDVGRFLDRGGALAWGIVPVNGDVLAGEDFDSLLNKLEKAIEVLVKAGVDKNLLLEQSFITPCCDAGLLTPDQTVKAWKLTSRIARTMREKSFPILTVESLK